MHHRRPATADRHGQPHQERSLIHVSFVGSFPAADFRVTPALPEVAFLGRSNVGKSSLINALVGRKAIARTSKTPGKTRDCNVYRLDDRLHLVDLPGYGYARVSKTERRRLELLIMGYLDTREPLVGVVWLLDVRRDPSAHDLELAARLSGLELPTLVAVTKGDKLPKGRRASQTQAIMKSLELPESQSIVTSAVTKDGVAELMEAIEALAEEEPAGP
jgi:GTP-binding protein